jgi:hypothetical protein
MSHFSISTHENIIFPLCSVSHSFSLYPPSSQWNQPPDSTCFIFLFSVFEKRQFYVFKIALHGVYLWHFYVHMHYNSNWFMPSIFLLTILVTLLWWFQ